MTKACLVSPPRTCVEVELVFEGIPLIGLFDTGCTRSIFSEVWVCSHPALVTSNLLSSLCFTFANGACRQVSRRLSGRLTAPSLHAEPLQVSIPVGPVGSRDVHLFCGWDILGPSGWGIYIDCDKGVVASRPDPGDTPICVTSGGVLDRSSHHDVMRPSVCPLDGAIIFPHRMQAHVNGRRHRRALL